MGLSRSSLQEYTQLYSTKTRHALTHQSTKTNTTTKSENKLTKVEKYKKQIILTIQVTYYLVNTNDNPDETSDNGGP